MAGTSLWVARAILCPFGHTDGLIGLAATLLKLIIGKDRGRQPHISTHAGASDRE